MAEEPHAYIHNYHMLSVETDTGRAMGPTEPRDAQEEDALDFDTEWSKFMSEQHQTVVEDPVMMSPDSSSLLNPQESSAFTRFLDTLLMGPSSPRTSRKIEEELQRLSSLMESRSAEDTASFAQLEDPQANLDSYAQDMHLQHHEGRQTHQNHQNHHEQHHEQHREHDHGMLMPVGPLSRGSPSHTPHQVDSLAQPYTSRAQSVHTPHGSQMAPAMQGTTMHGPSRSPHVSPQAQQQNMVHRASHSGPQHVPTPQPMSQPALHHISPVQQMPQQLSQMPQLSQQLPQMPQQLPQQLPQHVPQQLPQHVQHMPAHLGHVPPQLASQFAQVPQASPPYQFSHQVLMGTRVSPVVQPAYTGHNTPTPSGPSGQGLPYGQYSSYAPEYQANMYTQEVPLQKRPAQKRRASASSDETRINHVMSEKKRRATIKGLFTRLRDLVPATDALPKSTVLNLVYEHMRETQNENSRLRELLEKRGVPTNDIEQTRLDEVGPELSMEPIAEAEGISVTQ